MRWGVVVLAGGHEVGPLAERMKTPFKAMAQVAGAPCVQHVVARAVADGFTEGVVVGCAPSEHHAAPYAWYSDTGGAIGNAKLGVDALRDPCDAILFLASDTPLIEPGELKRFIQVVEPRIDSDGAWFAAGACPIQAFRGAYPQVPVKGIRLVEGVFVTGTLFAASPAGFDLAHSIVSEFRRHRKSAVRMLLRLGLGTCLRVIAGRANQGHAERAVSKLLGGRAVLDLSAHPSTCLDFDNVAEWDALLDVLAARH